MDDYQLEAQPIAHEALFTALRNLDQRLELAVQANDTSMLQAVPYHGLYISQEMAEGLLTQTPGMTLLDDEQPSLTHNCERFQWLGEVYRLSTFELDVILMALAAEVDLRYGRLFAYLQNDITCKRPSIDLVLGLLCSSPGEKLARRSVFLPNAPLIEKDLVHILPDDGHTPLLGRALKLDEQIVRVLLKLPRPDERLAAYCSWVVPIRDLAVLPLDTAAKTALTTIAQQSYKYFNITFSGPHDAMKRPAAEALAFEMNRLLLVVDSVRVADSEDPDTLLRLLLREAWLEKAILYLDNADVLVGGLQSLSQRLHESLTIVILSRRQPWHLREEMFDIFFPLPTFDQRRACWQSEVQRLSLKVAKRDLDIVADRFCLSADQIADAASTAHNLARMNSAGLLKLDDLLGAARQHTGHDLSPLARKVEAVYSWDDLVVSDEVNAQLRELCQRLTHRQQVLEEWGFQRKLSRGVGVSALFAGSAGTGKTMAAEVIANALGLDLYQIDLAGVVSKYIGETEKNLDFIFTSARNANGILFFDEADALFGKRSEVRDSHDRYANIEISYLLQKMEAYEGIAILTTNLRQNLDEAFMRRFAFMIQFPMPDEASRRQIWGRIWPENVPLGADVDLDYLAQAFPLSGGNIKNIALAATFLAAESGNALTMAHLFQATRREYQKMGKTLDEMEIVSAYAQQGASE